MAIDFIYEENAQAARVHVNLFFLRVMCEPNFQNLHLVLALKNWSNIQKQEFDSRYMTVWLPQN